MKYELLAIFPNVISDEDVTAEHKKLIDLVTSNSGSVVKDEIVGRKRFAYQVKTDRTGVYTYIQLELDPSSVNILEQAIRLNVKTRRLSITKYTESSRAAAPTMAYATQPKKDVAAAQHQELKPEDIQKLDTKIEELLNEEIK